MKRKIGSTRTPRRIAVRMNRIARPRSAGTPVPPDDTFRRQSVIRHGQAWLAERMDPKLMAQRAVQPQIGPDFRESPKEARSQERRLVLPPLLRRSFSRK